MQPKIEVRTVETDLPVRQKFLAGAETMYKAVSATYGPAGGNVLVRMPFGDPVLTRDGVTVARYVSSTNKGLKDQAESDAARVIYQASEKTNKTAGDGTTATVVQAYNILRLAHQQVAAGANAMLLRKQILDDARTITNWVKDKSVKATNEQLHEVATVSSGDPNIGHMIADTLIDVGLDGGVSIKEHDYPVQSVEKINGYVMDKGCSYLQVKVELESIPVFVTNKKMSTSADALPLIKLVMAQEDKRIVVIGDVSGDAFNVLYANTVKQDVPFEAVVIPPQAYGQEGMPFAEDIATYVGAKVFTDADNFRDLTAQSFGTASRLVVDMDGAIIMGGSGDAEAISTRAAEIKALIDDSKDTHAKDTLEKRYTKLVGKIANINIGCATATEREELRYRVEDALEATKSAMADGIVPGGATTLARATELEISPLTASALKATFCKLFENAGEDSTYRFKQVVKSKWGYGFNLRDMTEEPIDLSKAGIWDATRGVCQIIENAASAAGSLLTANVHVGIEDAKDE